MPKLRLMLLGGFQAQTSDSPIALPRKKAQMLLAYLALNPRQAHPRDKLATLLWGDASAEQARHNLRQTLFALRQALPAIQPPLLRNNSEGVSLDIAAVSVDVREFEELAAEGTVDALHHAAELYRGELLEGLSVAEPVFEDWLRAQRERLHELALSALAKLFALHRAAGVADAAIQVGLKLLALDPLEEMVHRELMRMYVAQGRRGAALRQYQICLDVLQREIGAEPEPDTKDLYRRILPQPSSRAGPPEPASAPSRRRRLPRGLHRRSAALQSEGALIGRESEMTRLRQTLGDAWRGHGRALMILGEAGVGKTRLIREVAVIASRRDGLVLLGRSHESERILAFGPWVEALRATLRPDVLVGFDEVWRTELGRLFPEVAAPDRPPLPTGESYVRLFEAVAQLVRHLATRQPLLIVLEDVHWADEISLRLLSFLGRRLDGCSVMLVATAREEEIAGAPTLALVLDELDRGGGLARLAVQPLSRTDTATLVRVLAGRHAGAASLTRFEERVWKLSEGNPFMIVETMQSLRDGAAIEAVDGLPVPERVRDVIVRSLGRLSDRARELVAAAAMIGRDFEFPLLQAASGLAAGAAAQDVEELVRRRVVHGVGDRFDFVHDRIREVADDQVLAPRRRLLHERVARAIETVYADDLAPHYAALGRHYREAQVWDQAATYLHAAGRQAAARSAFRDAVTLYELALNAAARLSNPAEACRSVVDLRIDLALARMALGDGSRLVEDLGEARQTAERLEDQPRVARACALLSRAFFYDGDSPRALEAGHAALAIGEALGDIGLQVSARLGLGEIYYALGQYSRALELLEKNVATVGGEQALETFGDFRPPLVTSHMFIASICADLGQFSKGQRHGEEALRIAEAVDRPMALVTAYRALGRVHLAEGDLGRAAAAFERALALHRTWQIGQTLAITSAELGITYVYAGRVTEGLPLLEQGADPAATSGIAKGYASMMMRRLALGYLAASRFADAIKCAKEAVELARTSLHKAVALEVRADILSRKDPPSLDEAAIVYLEALAIAEDLAARGLAARCQLGLGRIYRKLGDLEGARRLLTSAIEAYRDMGFAAKLRQAQSELRLAI